MDFPYVTLRWALDNLTEGYPFHYLPYDTNTVAAKIERNH